MVLKFETNIQENRNVYIFCESGLKGIVLSGVEQSPSVGFDYRDSCHGDNERFENQILHLLVGDSHLCVNLF